MKNCDDVTFRYIELIILLFYKIDKDYVQMGEDNGIISKGNNDAIDRLMLELTNVKEINWKLLNDNKLELTLDYSYIRQSNLPTDNNYGFNADKTINYDDVIEFFRISGWSVERVNNYTIKGIDMGTDSSSQMYYDKTDKVVITIPYDKKVTKVQQPPYSRSRAFRYRPKRGQYY